MSPTSYRTAPPRDMSFPCAERGILSPKTCVCRILSLVPYIVKSCYNCLLEILLLTLATYDNRFCNFVLVGMMGFEPIRPCGRGILSPLCIPFHHTPKWRNESHSTLLLHSCQGIVISLVNKVSGFDNLSQSFSRRCFLVDKYHTSFEVL